MNSQNQVMIYCSKMQEIMIGQNAAGTLIKIMFPNKFYFLLFLSLLFHSCKFDKKQIIVTEDQVRTDTITELIMYNEKPFSGILTYYDSLSESTFFVPYKKGKANGIVKSYYENG